MEYPDFEFVQAVLAQLTWYHNLTLLDKIKDKNTRLFYINKAVEHGWSRNIMIAEYALRDMTKPISLAEYRLTKAIPEDIQTVLPTIEELEAELSKDFREVAHG